MIAAERTRLADALAGLPAEDWDRPSLCGEWSVREVVAHVIATASTTPPAFFGKLAGSGFSLQRMVRKEIDRLAAQNGDEALVGLLRARVDARTAPPGPTPSWLGEAIVHGEDVFRALGGYLDHPVAHVLAVANFYQGSNLLIGAKKRIDGRRPSRHRRGVAARLRAAGRGAGHRARHGHDRPQGGAGRPVRRGRRGAARSRD